MTEYVVLRYQRVIQEAKIEGGAYVQIGFATARSSASAIREVLDGLEQPFIEDTFVAVPARSWKPVTVKVETKTALKFS